MRTIAMTCLTVLALSALPAGPVWAQQPGSAPQAHPIKRTVLQTIRVPNSNYELVMVMAEFASNDVGDRHFHNGPEVGYVIQGSGSIVVDGQAPLKLEVGQSYKLPAGTVHGVQSGPHGMKLIVNWVAEEGSPLALPAN
jgi:quercetin dioxygenase-like cupin family protein